MTISWRVLTLQVSIDINLCISREWAEYYGMEICEPVCLFPFAPCEPAGLLHFSLTPTPLLSRLPPTLSLMSLFPACWMLTRHSRPQAYSALTDHAHDHLHILKAERGHQNTHFVSHSSFVRFLYSFCSFCMSSFSLRGIVTFKWWSIGSSGNLYAKTV